ncbi:MAG: hypothetical protein PVH36_08210 [Desulfobacterales bacterium]|jgi:hypothetical protein
MTKDLEDVLMLGESFIEGLRLMDTEFLTEKEIYKLADIRDRIERELKTSLKGVIKGLVDK